MPQDKKTYKINDQVIDIPAENADKLLEKYPDAVEMKTFTYEDQQIDIPLEKVQQFQEKYPDAKELYPSKKKEESVSAGPGTGSKFVPERSYKKSEAGDKETTATEFSLDEVKDILMQNKDKDFVQRILMDQSKAPFIEDYQGTGMNASHRMSAEIVDGKNIVFPTIVNWGGKLIDLAPGDDKSQAIDYALKSGEYIEFPTIEQADAFSRDEGYKQIWDKKEKTYITPDTPYAETLSYLPEDKQKQVAEGMKNIPAAFKNFAAYNVLASYEKNKDKEGPWISSDFQKLKKSVDKLEGELTEYPIQQDAVYPVDSMYMYKGEAYTISDPPADLETAKKDAEIMAQALYPGDDKITEIQREINKTKILRNQGVIPVNEANTKINGLEMQWFPIYRERLDDVAKELRAYIDQHPQDSDMQSYALMKVDKAIREMDMAEGKKGGILTALKELPEVALDAVSFGFSNIAGSKGYKEIAEKYNRGEKLTPQEENVLYAYAIEQDVRRISDMPISYAITSGAMNSIPYMIQFGVTRVPANAIERGAARTMGVTTAKNSISNTIKKGAAWGIGKSAQALIMPSTYSRFIEGQTPPVLVNKEDENLSLMVTDPEETPRESFTKGYLSSLSAVVSETILDGLGGNPIPKSFMGRLAKKGGWNGISKEFTEELLDMFGSQILVEGEPVREVYSPRNLFTTFGSVALLGGGIMGSDKVAGNNDFMNVNTAEMNEAGAKLSADLKDEIDRAIEKSENVDQIGRNLEVIFDKGIKDKNWDKDQIETAFQYSKAKYANKVAEQTIQAQREEDRKGKKEPAPEKVETKKAEKVTGEEVAEPTIPKPGEEKAAETPKEAPTEEIAPEVKEEVAAEKEAVIEAEKAPKEEAPLKEDYKGKIVEKPELENPVRRVVVNGKERFIQRVEGATPGVAEWYEVTKNKKGEWEGVEGRKEDITKVGIGDTVKEAVETLKSKTYEKEGMQEERPIPEEGVRKEVTEEGEGKGKEGKILAPEEIQEMADLYEKDLDKFTDELIKLPGEQQRAVMDKVREPKKRAEVKLQNDVNEALAAGMTVDKRFMSMKPEQRTQAIEEFKKTPESKEFIKGKEEYASQMGTMREEGKGQEPQVGEKGEPLRSMYGEYGPDTIRKAIQKVGDIKTKKPKELVQQAKSVEELDYLKSQGRVKENAVFRDKMKALKEAKKLKDKTGRINAFDAQIKSEQPTKNKFVSEVTKGAEAGIKFLDEIDKELTQFGKTTAGMNLPVALAQIGVKAAKTALYAGKSASQAIDAAINAVMDAVAKARKAKTKPKWYDQIKNVSDAEIERSIRRVFEKGASEETLAKPPAGKKARAVAERIQLDKNISEEIRKGLSENAKYYVPISNEVTEREAQAIIDAKFAETGTHDNAIAMVTNQKNDMPFRTRVVVSGKLIDSINKQMAETADEDIRNQLKEQALKVAEFITDYGTQLGQGVQAFAVWASINTETIISKFQKEVKRLRNSELSKDEIQKLKRLSQKVKNAAEGHQKTRAIFDMLAYQMRLKGITWADVAMSVWYAHVLSGYSTHMLNAFANMAQTFGELAVSIVKNPRAAFHGLRGLYSGYGRGILEGWMTLKTGYAPVKSVKFSMSADLPSVLEAYNGFKMFNRRWNPWKFHKYVGRAMSAVDTFFYHGLKGMRSYELARMEIDGKGKTLKEVNDLINEKLGQTKERKAAVEKLIEQESTERVVLLEKEIEEFQKDLEKAESPKVIEEIKNQIARTKKELKKAQSKGGVYKKGSIDYKRRYWELMEESMPNEIVEDANNFSALGTFNHPSEGTLGFVTDGVAKITQNVPGLKFVVPFTRILSNVANAYLDWTPYGFVRAAKGGIGMRYQRSEWGKNKYTREYTRDEQVREYIKASLGTAAGLILYALSQIEDENGEPLFEITAAGTGNFIKNFELMKIGWQEYSIKIGGKWYSYKNTPLAIPMQVVGTISDYKKYRSDAFKDKSFADKVGMLTWSTFQYFTDFTFLSGLSEFMGSISESNEGSAVNYLTRFGENISKSFVVPNLFTQVSRLTQNIMDIPMKEANTYLEKFYRDFPIARRGLNDMVNGLGEPVIADIDRYISASEPDRIWNFIVKNKAWIGKPPKSVRTYDLETGQDRELDNDEYYKYAKLRGQKIKALIEGSWDELQTMDKADVQERINDYKRKANKEAKSDLLFGQISYDLNRIKKEYPKAFEALKEFKGFRMPSTSKSIWDIDQKRYLTPDELDEYRSKALDEYISLAGDITGNFDKKVMKELNDEMIPTVEGEEVSLLQYQLDQVWKSAKVLAAGEMTLKMLEE